MSVDPTPDADPEAEEGRILFRLLLEHGDRPARRDQLRCGDEARQSRSDD